MVFYCMSVPQLIYPSNIDEYLTYFWFGPIKNSAVNILEVSFGTYICSLLLVMYTPKSESYGL